MNEQHKTSLKEIEHFIDWEELRTLEEILLYDKFKNILFDKVGNINIKNGRLYTIAIDVYSVSEEKEGCCEDIGYLAIKHITEIHTDGMYIDDPNRRIEAYPVKKNENGDFEIQDNNNENNDLAF